LVAYFPIPSILSAILLFLILPDCKKPTLVRMGRWGQGAGERRKARFFVHLLRIKKLTVKIIDLKVRD
jgi:hypothetical protein